jgi:hypothetical protein
MGGEEWWSDGVVEWWSLFARHDQKPDNENEYDWGGRKDSEGDQGFGCLSPLATGTDTGNSPTTFLTKFAWIE